MLRGWLRVIVADESRGDADQHRPEWCGRAVLTPCWLSLLRSSPDQQACRNHLLPAGSSLQPTSTSTAPGMILARTTPSPKAMVPSRSTSIFRASRSSVYIRLSDYIRPRSQPAWVAYSGLRPAAPATTLADWQWHHVKPYRPRRPSEDFAYAYPSWILPPQKESREHFVNPAACMPSPASTGEHAWSTGAQGWFWSLRSPCNLLVSLPPPILPTRLSDAPSSAKARPSRSCASPAFSSLTKQR